MSESKNKKKELTLKEQQEADKAYARKTMTSSPNSSSNSRANKVVGKYKNGGSVGNKKVMPKKAMGGKMGKKSC
jgi:hypothetical protein